MNLFNIFLIFIIWLNYNRAPFTAALNGDKTEMCPFEQTVNLTNLQKFVNASYVYQGVFIPPEKQDLYDRYEEFLGDKKSVPLHLRGCVCDKRACTKLCCAADEYYDDTKNSTSKCEKLRPNMTVSWDLPVRLSENKTKILNIFKDFTTQVGWPCQQPKAIDLEDKAVLQQNGTLFIEGDNSELTTRDYCYSPRYDTKTKIYALTPFSCPMNNEYTWQLKLNTYAMAVSVVFLLPTIVVYLVLKELRRNLNGKLLICYLSSLTISYGIIAFINISSLRFDLRFGRISCSLLGFTCYFFFMSAFLWLSVMCFDIWKSFKETSVEMDSRRNLKYFITYSLYVWLSAGLATSFLFYIQVSPNVDDLYKPDIGQKRCWLNTDKWSALIYFYGPNLIILLFNLITFGHLTATIYSIRRDLARMTQKEKFFQENVVVIFRLFLIMGISWIFDILSYCVREYKEWDFMFVISDFTNAIQGLLIFSLFVLKPNVLKLLKNRFRNITAGKSGGSVSSTATNFSKLQTSTSVSTPVVDSDDRL